MPKWACVTIYVRQVASELLLFTRASGTAPEACGSSGKPAGVDKLLRDSTQGILNVPVLDSASPKEFRYELEYIKYV